MGLSNLSVKARLFVTLAVPAAALLAVGLLGLQELRQSHDELNDVYNDNFRSATLLGEVASKARDNALTLDELLMTGDAPALATYKLEVAEISRQTDELWARYEATPMEPGEKELSDAVKQARLSYRAMRNSIADDVTAGELDQARRRRVQELQPYLDTMIANTQKLIDLQMELAAQANQSADATYARASFISWTAMILGIGLAATFGLLLVRSMLGALATAVHVSERISAGELGQDFEVNGNDEFARLLGALKQMDRKLCEIVGAVRTGADEVGAAARQLSNGNDDLSQRTQEQASALEETASSMEEMTATVKQNADNARQASQLASGARVQADKGGAVVGRAVSAMGEISESSRRIADIIDVIDEIAFQTNLLALNAAVEAARAGEQGRGFAVVATEVRNLAQRSASAAKEIKDLIGDSVEKVKAGTALVDESGLVLTEIVASVKKVADIVMEISAASEEQAAGIEQVNTAVTQMDSVTQQNAALVEESSAASKSMEHQAQALVEKIAFFRTGRNVPTAAAAAVAPRVITAQAAHLVQPKDAPRYRIRTA